MKDLLPYLIVGITSGSLYGLAGMGLVLTFKTTGIFNFAHGAIAALSAYVFFDLHVRHGIAWPVAFALCVLVVGPAVGLVIERLGRSLGNGRPMTALLATVGLLLFLQGALQQHYGSTQLQFPNFLPTGGIDIVGVEVQYLQITVVVTSLLSAIGLYVFFQRTRLGLSMRAVVDNPALLDLTGVPLRRIRRTSWCIGCSFASATGIFIAPSLGLQVGLLTLLVVQAFGAAAIGRFSSLPMTYVGGLAVGVLAALSTRLVADQPNLIGLPASVPFVVLFGVLLLTPSDRFPVEIGVRSGGHRMPPLRARSVAAQRARRAGAGAVLLALLVLPQLVGTKLPVFMSGLCLAIVMLSLALLVTTSGQISLCHAVFVAIGATTFAHLSTAGVPWLLALLGAGLACVPVGAVVAVPAIRLSGVYLALATFGFGLLMQRVVFPLGVMFGAIGYREAPRPSFVGIDLTSDKAFYYVLLATAIACAAVVAVLERGQLGGFLRGLADSPTALSTHGLDVSMLRLIVFCLSAALAGVGGAVTVANVSQVSGQAFDPFTSLLWLATLALCGRRLVPSAAIAAALLAIVPSYVPNAFTDAQTTLFGAAALAVAVVSTGGVVLPAGRQRDRARRGPVQSRLKRVDRETKPLRVPA